MDEVLERLRAEMHARYDVTRTEPIELGRVRDYLLAMDEPAEVGPGEIVPPLFLLTLGRTRRPQPSAGSAVKAGDEYEFHAPVRVGDTLTVEQRLADIQVKQGRRGTMYLIVSEATFRNQHGEVVGIGRAKSMRWGS
ncbi:MAG: MaoC family dehydratase N-terminal domain-containing protein [Gammaproteobacteria bacterium]